MKDLHDVILKPVISEKSLLEAKSGQYTFLTGVFATKTDIKKAVAALFGVTVEKVRTSIVKTVSHKNMRYGRAKREYSYKKARVRIAAGEKIALFEEVVD